jgi:hypothetical protein
MSDPKQAFHHRTPDSRTSTSSAESNNKNNQELPTPAWVREHNLEDIPPSSVAVEEKPKIKVIKTNKKADISDIRELSNTPEDIEVESVKSWTEHHKGTKRKAEHDKQDAAQILARHLDEENKHKEQEAKNAEDFIVEKTKEPVSKWQYAYGKNSYLPHAHDKIGRAFYYIMDQGDKGADIDVITGKAFLTEEEKKLPDRERFALMTTKRERAVEQGLIKTFDGNSNFGNSELRWQRQFNGNPHADKNQRPNDLIIKIGNRLFINKTSEGYEKALIARKALDESHKEWLAKQSAMQKEQEEINKIEKQHAEKVKKLAQEEIYKEQMQEEYKRKNRLNKIE